MTKYVALLRGISPTNPNMRNEKLRATFESLGFSNVQTVISSGNVLFESKLTDIPKLESMIEAALPSLGFSSTTIIRSQQQLQELVRHNPFAEVNHDAKHYLTVTFLKHAAATKLSFPFQPSGKTYKLLALYDQAVFSIVDLTGDRTPDLMVWLEKQFGKDITTRTWKTVGRILKKF